MTLTCLKTELPAFENCYSPAWPNTLMNNTTRYRVRCYIPRSLLILFLLGFPQPCKLSAQEIPHLDRAAGSTQLIDGGKPFVILGGELGNSSAGTAAQADQILPRLARAHINTVLMPVAWEQIEPVEGKFDFSILDHWIEQARTQHLHLVLLWFGSWKNAFSSYAPDWIKRDTKRFPRAIAPSGRPLEILSALSKENVGADSRAFRALMHHLKEFDAQPQIVLMVQVENEVGILDAARDHSAEADREFNGPVPAELLKYLRANSDWLSPEVRHTWNPDGRTWRAVFADHAPEIFTAWNYARYIGEVAAAGKSEYRLPMFVNAQLPAALERAGEYPSGGPHPKNLEIYRAAAPALDFYSPDIYWPDFEYWLQRYSDHGNPIFVPEARLDAGPFNSFYAYGAARAFGFSPFDVEKLPDVESEADESKNPLAQTYSVLQQLTDILPQAQREDRTRGLAAHANSPRAKQSVSLGGYLFTATLARSWPARTLLQDDGAMILLQTGPDEFLMGGTALSIAVSVDPDTSDGIAGIASVEEGSRVNGEWITARRLNGDQSDQGRAISLPDHRVALLRVRLYKSPGTNLP
jgi:beta-galactosidase GanA